MMLLNVGVIFGILLLIGLATPSIVGRFLYHIVDQDLLGRAGPILHPRGGHPGMEGGPLGMQGGPLGMQGEPPGMQGGTMGGPPPMNGPFPPPGQNRSGPPGGNPRDFHSNFPNRPPPGSARGSLSGPPSGGFMQSGSGKRVEALLPPVFILGTKAVPSPAYDENAVIKMAKSPMDQPIFTSATRNGDPLRIMTVRIRSNQIDPYTDQLLGLRPPVPPRNDGSNQGNFNPNQSGNGMGQPLGSRMGPPPKSQPVILQFSESLKSVDLTLASLRLALAALIPIGLILAGFGGYWMGRVMFSQFGKLSGAADAIQGSDLSLRLPLLGEDEFTDLSRSFNSLLDRVEAAYQLQHLALENQRRFIADASHELRTPLTVIKGRTSLALSNLAPESPFQTTFDAIDSAADSMSDLVSKLLILTRMDSVQNSKPSVSFLVSDFINEVVRQIPLPDQDRVRISISPEVESVSLRGQKDDLIRAISNLLMNGLRYSAADSSVFVEVRSVLNGLELKITDHGIGIPESAIPRLGERFFRVDEARNRLDGGTGLGISIAKAIIENHHGTLAFESKVEVGTQVFVFLPTSD